MQDFAMSLQNKSLGDAPGNVTSRPVETKHVSSARNPAANYSKPMRSGAKSDKNMCSASRQRLAITSQDLDKPKSKLFHAFCGLTRSRYRFRSKYFKMILNCFELYYFQNIPTWSFLFLSRRNKTTTLSFMVLYTANESTLLNREVCWEPTSAKRARNIH